MKKLNNPCIGIKGICEGGEPANESDHYIICDECGQVIDQRDPEEIYHHTQLGHKPYNPCIGIKGVREGGEPANESGHYIICDECGQAVDRRDLGEIYHHMQLGHKPLEDILRIWTPNLPNLF